MSIKKKLLGSFIISFVFISIIFMTVALPNFREHELDRYRENVFMNMGAIDEYLEYITYMEPGKLGEKEETMDKEVLHEIYSKRLISFIHDTWKGQLGTFNLYFMNKQITISGDSDIQINPMDHELETCILDTLKKGGMDEIEIDQKKYYIFAKDSEYLDLTYYQIVDKKELRDFQFETIEPLIMIGSIFFVLFSAFLLFFIHKIVIIPINKLNNVTTEIVETKDLDTKVDINCTDEIGETAKSFNSMVDALRHLTDNLESLVEQRTKKLEKAKKEADAANVAKSEFLANMSHEIRTPINAVVGLTDLIKGTELNFKQKDYIDKIKKSSNNLLKIINDILDFSKVEAGKMTIESVPFDLEEILEDIGGITGVKAAQQEIELILKLDNDVPRNLIGDPVRLHQVILNLLNNAIKFTEEGEVLLEISVLKDYEEEVELNFKIKDTGIGMDEESLEHLFDEFTQADTTTTRKYGGTGLGLAIANDLVALMGGEIDVKSEVGKGTIFNISLSLEKAEEKSRKTIEILPEIENLRVLIVDDNEDARITFVEYIKEVTDTYYSVKNGVEAIEALKLNDYDLMILDYKMDPLNGFETMNVIYDNPEINKVPKVLMTTAYGKEIFDGDLITYKIDYILMKPVHKKSLIDMINKMFTKEVLEEEVTEAKKYTFEGRVLVVEDNEINQMVIIENLENKGLEVDVANNGKIAVEKVSEKEYDLILMDLQMPVCDGYEASEEILKFKPTQPIIALSADVFPGVKQRVKEVGMIDYVSKPIDFGLLFSKMESLEISKKQITSKQKKSTRTQLKNILELFDVEEGIRRMGGNEKAYLKVLTKFQENSRDLLEEIMYESNQGNIETVLPLLHQFKGVAGNVGFTKGFLISQKIEKALKEGKEESLEEIDTLKEVVERGVRQINAIDIPEEVASNTQVLDDDIKTLFDKLEGYLESYDIEAESLVMNNQALFIKNSLEDVYQKLLQAIGEYDYEGALKLLNRIR